MSTTNSCDDRRRRAVALIEHLKSGGCAKFDTPIYRSLKCAAPDSIYGDLLPQFHTALELKNRIKYEKALQLVEHMEKGNDGRTFDIKTYRLLSSIMRYVAKGRSSAYNDLVARFAAIVNHKESRRKKSAHAPE